MKNDVYGEPDIIKEKNIIAKVYSPIIDEKERARRMDAIKKASVDIVLSKYERGQNVRKTVSNS